MLYSNSKLSTYENCPWRYKLVYIDKIEKPEKQGIEAFMGSMVHDVLEKCHKDLIVAHRNTVDDLIRFYNIQWDKEWTDEIQIVRKQYKKEDYKNSGEKCIRDYFTRYAPFDKTRTIATEMMVNFPIDEEKKYLGTGFIDRLDISRDNTYEIHDYKTSRNLPTQEKADSDRQLGLYHIAVQTKWPDARDIKLIWHYLIFDKELLSSRTSGQVKQLKTEVMSLIDEIEEKTKELEEDSKGTAAQKIFPANETTLCDWCEFQGQCPKFRHSIIVEALPENEYLKEPGVKLVNKLADLSVKKGEIEAQVEEIEEEMGKIKEAIAAYADKNKLDTIEGKNCSASINRKNILKFPGKNEDGRQELEGIIKKEDKWAEVSTLDNHALSRVVSSKSWPAKLLDKILSFGRKESKVEVRLKQMKDSEE